MPGSFVTDAPAIDPALARQLTLLRASLEPIGPEPRYRSTLRAQLVAQAERAALEKAAADSAPAPRRRAPVLERPWRRLLAAGVVATVAGTGLATASAAFRTDAHPVPGPAPTAALPPAPPPAAALAPPVNAVGTAGLPLDPMQAGADRLAAAQGRWERALHEHASEPVLHGSLVAVADAADGVLRLIRAAPSPHAGLPVVDGPDGARLSELAAHGQAVLAFVRPALSPALKPQLARGATALAGVGRATGWVASPLGTAGSPAPAASSLPRPAVRSAGSSPGSVGAVPGSSHAPPAAPRQAAPAVTGATGPAGAPAPPTPPAPMTPTRLPATTGGGLLPMLGVHTTPASLLPVSAGSAPTSPRL